MGHMSRRPAHADSRYRMKQPDVSDYKPFATAKAVIGSGLSANDLIADVQSPCFAIHLMHLAK